LRQRIELVHKVHIVFVIYQCVRQALKVLGQALRNVLGNIPNNSIFYFISFNLINLIDLIVIINNLVLHCINLNKIIHNSYNLLQLVYFMN
jgi:hypothetical protein